MAVTINLGHKLSMALVFLDQNGNPMLTPPAPDAAPSWSNTTPTTETLTVASDGLSCAATQIALGNDTVQVSLNVGGTTLTASLDVSVTDVPQVMKSVVIAPTVT